MERKRTNSELSVTPRRSELPQPSRVQAGRAPPRTRARTHARMHASSCAAASARPGLFQKVAFWCQETTKTGAALPILPPVTPARPTQFTTKSDRAGRTCVDRDGSGRCTAGEREAGSQKRFCEGLGCSDGGAVMWTKVPWKQLVEHQILVNVLDWHEDSRKMRRLIY